MNQSEVMALLRERSWTVTALAERWQYTRRHVTAQIANERRGLLWDDALRGLPEGPGFYRKLGKQTPVSQYDLVVGSIVASEGDLYNFDYGTRGVVIEELGGDRWRVAWDGGSELDIDAECLGEWVSDLGHEVSWADELRETPVAMRLELAQRKEIRG